MILLNKKRILFITSSILCSIISCDFVNQKLIKSQQVSSTPVSSHVVILDAGHGNPDGGATNSNGEIIESDLNLQITLKLQNLLESANCTVVLTRSDENGIYEAEASSIREKKISDMKNRVKIANDSEADILVSIHMNKLEQTQYSGWQTFYKKDDEQSKSLAQKIQRLNRGRVLPNRTQNVSHPSSIAAVPTACNTAALAGDRISIFCIRRSKSSPKVAPNKTAFSAPFKFLARSKLSKASPERETVLPEISTSHSVCHILTCGESILYISSAIFSVSASNGLLPYPKYLAVSFRFKSGFTVYII